MARARVRLRVESLVHGGEALARHEGRVVFLRGVAPGDLIEAELDGEGRYERAQILRVLEPGPQRTAAPCPIVDACGGCPLQHVELQAQLAAKQALTADALLRIGGLAAGSYELAPLVPSPRPFRYRRRARLHRAANRAWGFARAGAAAVEPVAECLLFEPALQQLADAVRAAGELPGVLDLGLLTAESGRKAVDLRTEGPPSPSLRARARRLLEEVRALRGATLGPLGAAEVVGEPVLSDPLDPALAGAFAGKLRLRARPDGFAQANRAMVPLLQRAALDALGDAASVLELFCGSGTLTLPLLAAGRSVTAVESSAVALQLLRRSADEAGLAVRLVAGDAARVAGSLEGTFDAVLLDPPRTGAAGAVQAAAALKPARIVYVSCDAPTLARDARLLSGAGYRLARAAPLDLFPQTAHFEIVATFQRGA